MRRDNREPDRRDVMKKFNLKNVLDNFRTSVAQPSRADQEVLETLRPENFQVKRTFRHGFPFQPTAMAFDPVQRLLVIGSKCGSLRILGQPGVDIHVRHDMDGPPGSSAVLHLQFLVNEGALVSATADDSLHLWNFRQKVPQIVQSLKFQKEKITCLHLPLQSKWVYVGTERGNIHVVQLENFILSGYIINWNKTIEASRKTHPGAIVHLSDNPSDENKLLVGYESGQVVLWDLRNKYVELRWQMNELRSISWHYDGKQFLCSHADGTLTTWATKSCNKYLTVIQPHARVAKDGKLEQCKPISKVDWKWSNKSGEIVIFSGGTPYDQSGRSPSITVYVPGRNTTLLEMEHPVVDFITLCESIYDTGVQDPYAIIVLLQNDLVVIDLLTPGCPSLDNPYPMDIHKSPVTCCTYLADCPADLIPAFYSVGRSGAAGKGQGSSEMDWPISGGTWSAQSSGYSEVILTGHADGSIKFWDASAGTLQVLYKLKTCKIFEKPKSRSMEGEEDPLAIEIISLCPESRKLCVAGASSHVILFTYKKTESNDEVTVLEIPIVYEVPDESDISPDCQFSGPGSAGSGNKIDLCDLDNKRDTPTLKVRSGSLKKPPGFQAQLVCLTPWNNGEAPSHITALTINSSYGLLAYGNEAGLVIIDIEQKVCLLNVGSPDLYGAQDPYSRVPRSPKRGGINVTDTLPIMVDRDERQPRSPSIDQMGRSPESPYSLCPCPTPIEQASEAVEDEKAVPIPSASTGAAAAATAGAANHNNNNRRKSSTWKGFNLKRQLSKVDMKFKNSLKEKRNSIFYSDFSPPDREAEVEEECYDKSSPESDESTVVDNQSVIDLSLNPKEDHNAEEVAEVIQFSPGEDSDSVESRMLQRPDNLDLVDEDGCPVPPPRRNFKKKSQNKRDQRLLSVPNIKFQKCTEFHTFKDLREREESVVSPQASFTGNLMRRFNKLDSSFSRSRSSSMSSLENITSEAIQCLVFTDSFAKKTEPNLMSPTLWVGTSLGSVLTILINPPDPDSRSSQPVVVSLVGVTIFRLKGAILTMSFLDYTGSLIPNTYESWRDDNRDKREKTPTKTQNRMSPTLGSDFQNRGDSSSSSSASSFMDRQFVVIASEKQARVVALPSQTCLYRQQLTDADFAVKAEVISMRDSVCLVCYMSNGHLSAFTLPSLRPLIDIDFLPLSELSFQTQSNKGIVDPMLSIWGQQLIVNEDTDQIARTFCFSNRGHGLYLTSPSELQKFTLCMEFCQNFTEMMGELFLPLEMPEPPKEGFLKNLGFFGGGVKSLDREELFGESSGKANKTVAKHIPGSVQEMGGRVTSVTSEISRAHRLALERGEKLSQLEDKAEKMRSEAENFSSTAHDLMLKYKEKKWYQL